VDYIDVPNKIGKWRYFELFAKTIFKETDKHHRNK